MVPKPRLGFTLIELLVVMAIIAVLVGILLPAVQKVRETAARTKCSNNMKQIALGAQNFHTTQNRLPNGNSYSSTGGNPGSGTGRGWMVELLNYVEQDNLYNQFVSGGRPAAQQRTVEIFICPSDPDAKDGAGRETYSFSAGGLFGVPGTYGLTSYAGNAGPIRHLSDGQQSRRAFTGVIARNGVEVEFDSIKDGLSNTLLAGEVMPYACNFQSWAHESWAYADYPINQPRQPDNIPGFAENFDDNMGFRSQHPGGANFAFCDGSVRFINDSKAANPAATSGNSPPVISTLQALSTRKNGDQPGDF